MTEQLAWYEAHPQPKILNRQPGYWLCILGCGKDTCRGHGETPEDAIYDASQEQAKQPVDRNRPILPRVAPAPVLDLPNDDSDWRNRL